MKIEAVTVCVNYADFLQETVKYNAGLFDAWTIVTDPQDNWTREVCRKYNLKCIISEDAKRFGTPFAKGRLVERGLQHQSADGWRIQVDADVVLPHDFRKRLVAADLQEDMIYGIDRVMVKNWNDWQSLLKSGYINGGQFDYHCRIGWPIKKEVGTRWAHPQFGYVPIGFFQMWNSSQDEWRGIRIKPYPLNHSNACRTDVQFALQWDRHKRAVIPEVIGIHLESENADKGANWNGRKTKLFGPPGMKAGVSGPQGY